MDREKNFCDLMNYCMQTISFNLIISNPALLKKSLTNTLEAIQDALRLRSIPDRQIRPLSRKLCDCLFGQALLIELLSDPLVSDIKILSYDKIRLKCLNRRKSASFCFQNPGQYLHFVEYLLSRNGLRLDGPHAYLTFCDSSSSPTDLLCFHITSRRINSVNTPYLHVHRIPKEKKYLKDLIASGMLSEKNADYLLRQVQNGRCILFTGSGRQEQHLLLNALIDLIPHSKSALAIQEQEELFSLSHPEIMFQHTTPTSQTQISYDTGELMENGLLLDSDYFILDELKPENALPFWRAVSHGCHCWTTVPGKNARQAVECLMDYLCREASCPRETVLPSLGHISSIVCLNRGKVTELVEVQGWDTASQNLKLINIL